MVAQKMLIVNMRQVGNDHYFLHDFMNMTVGELVLSMLRFETDGESGIQVKEVCDEVTILQRVDEFAQSSSATGQGSNHIVVESTQHKRLGKKDLTGDNGSHINLQYKANQVHRGHGSSNHDEFTGSHEMAVSDFQGENQPVMEQGIFML